MRGTLPLREGCRPCLALDLSESVSPGAVAFDRDHLDALTAIWIIGREGGPEFYPPMLRWRTRIGSRPDDESYLEAPRMPQPSHYDLANAQKRKNYRCRLHTQMQAKFSGSLKLGADAAQHVV